MAVDTMGNPYSLSNLKRVLSDWKIARGAVRHLAMQINSRYYAHSKPSQVCDVMAEEWDNLLLLDGCRYDAFAEVCSFDGQLKQRVSAGSATEEWTKANFEGETFHDTVYLTTNPFTLDLPDGTFHAVINCLSECWDDDLGTVPPKPVVEKARTARAKYPNKRLIVHFIQPHFPFIGEFGQTLPQSGFTRPGDTEARGNPIWTRMQFGFDGLTESEVRNGYIENLELVYDAVEDLLPALPGRTVISADHGNLIGDRCCPLPVKAYGHPSELYHPDLVKVPWFVIEAQNRPKIVPEEPVETTSMDSGTVQDRLSALGYQ